jgi:hypothetical protein
MQRCLIAVFALALLLAAAPALHAQALPRLAVAVDVRHVGKDKWRVDYRFSRPVTAIKLGAVGDYRKQAWTLRTPGMVLRTESGFDQIEAGGKPFTKASIDIRTFDGVAPKSYAPFTRFTDGGTAFFLGHLHGDALHGTQSFAMANTIRLHGLQKENVIAPPPNALVEGGERGYAYFGPAKVVAAGTVQLLLDPATPAWMRETLLDTGDKVARYYERAYGRPLKDQLFIMMAVAGFEKPGFSVQGGATMGQLNYRVEGASVLRDLPVLREHMKMLVAHEMAHLWQMNIARGGVGEADPWIHEGGAEAMALDGLAQAGIWDQEKVTAYRSKKAALCDQLGGAVSSYDGIYACGLMRFDRMGMPIVPLWRALIQATEVKGEVYSVPMLKAVGAQVAD